MDRVAYACLGRRKRFSPRGDCFRAPRRLYRAFPGPGSGLIPDLGRYTDIVYDPWEVVLYVVAVAIIGVSWVIFSRERNGKQ